MVIGDAANHNKPFSGEGVTSGFTGARIAAEVAVTALRKFLDASGKAGKIKAHYLKFPETPAELPAWASETHRLWGEAG